MRLHAQQEARRPLARAHPLRQRGRRRFHLAREANPGAFRRARQQLQQVFRLRRLNEARLTGSQACNLAGQCRLEQARRFRRLSEARLAASRAVQPRLRLTAKAAQYHL